MLRKRLFPLLIAIAVAILLAFTVREALATTALITPRAAAVCSDLPSRYSIQSQYNRQAQGWILYTEDGPAGVDGGWIELASAYRTCTK